MFVKNFTIKQIIFLISMQGGGKEDGREETEEDKNKEEEYRGRGRIEEKMGQRRGQGWAKQAGKDGLEEEHCRCRDQLGKVPLLKMEKLCPR